MEQNHSVAFRSLDQLMDAIELIDTNGFVWVGASDLASLGDYVWEHRQAVLESEL